MLTVSTKTLDNLFRDRDHAHHGDNKACLRIRCLYSGLPSRLERRLQIAVLQAWFDDSGRGKEEPTNPVFVLAGYAASVETFKSFSDDWEDLLNEKPCLEYVKGKEAHDRIEQFQGWTEEARDKKIAKFISLIRDHKLIALSLAINYGAFNRLLRQPKAPMNYPYGLAFSHVVAWLVYSAKTKKPEPETVELIFDNGVTGRERNIRAAYKGIKEAFPPEDLKFLFREQPRFEDDKKFVSLQAADLLAFNSRRDYAEQLRNRRRWESPTWSELRRDIRGRSLYLGEPELLEMKNQYFDHIIRRQLALKISI